MTTRTPLAALLSALLLAALAGCVTGAGDLHRPKTIVASEEGGQVSIAHGQRLFLPLKSEAGVAEWRRVEPKLLMVLQEGAPELDGMMFTAVRTGQEALRLEYRPLAGGEPQKTVSYDIEVR